MVATVKDLLGVAVAVQLQGRERFTSNDSNTQKRSMNKRDAVEA